MTTKIEEQWALAQALADWKTLHAGFTAHLRKLCVYRMAMIAFWLEQKGNRDPSGFPIPLHDVSQSEALDALVFIEEALPPAIMAIVRVPFYRLHEYVFNRPDAPKVADEGKQGS